MGVAFKYILRYTLFAYGIITYGVISSGNQICRLSNAINKVFAVDVVASKVDLINSKKSPIVDKEIEEYLVIKDLDLVASLDFDEFKRLSKVIIAN